MGAQRSENGVVCLCVVGCARKCRLCLLSLIWCTLFAFSSHAAHTLYHSGYLHGHPGQLVLLSWAVSARLFPRSRSPSRQVGIKCFFVLANSPCSATASREQMNSPDIELYIAQKLSISAFQRYMGRHASEFIFSFDFASPAENRIFWSELTSKSS